MGGCAVGVRSSIAASAFEAHVFQASLIRGFDRPQHYHSGRPYEQTLRSLVRDIGSIMARQTSEVGSYPVPYPEAVARITI
jgi:hypothetical protein